MHLLRLCTHGCLIGESFNISHCLSAVLVQKELHGYFSYVSIDTDMANDL